jgi:hypothetical protein
MVNRGFTRSRKMGLLGLTGLPRGAAASLCVYWSLPREIMMVDSVLVLIQRMSRRR